MEEDVSVEVREAHVAYVIETFGVPLEYRSEAPDGPPTLAEVEAGCTAALEASRLRRVVRANYEDIRTWAMAEAHRLVAWS